MAMPKKGRRKIVVDNVTYYYSIKPYIKLGPESNGGKLTVELEENTYATKAFSTAVTPSMVEEFIRERVWWKENE